MYEQTIVYSTVSLKRTTALSYCNKQKLNSHMCWHVYCKINISPFTEKTEEQLQLVNVNVNVWQQMAIMNFHDFFLLSFFLTISTISLRFNIVAFDIIQFSNAKNSNEKYINKSLHKSLNIKTKFVFKFNLKLSYIMSLVTLGQNVKSSQQI